MLKVIKFSAVWCPPCNMLTPIFKKAMEEFPGVEVVLCDIDENPELTAKMNIKSVPTIVILRDGKVMDAIVGLVKKEEIIARVSALITKE